MWNEVEKNYYALEKSIPMPKSYINEYAMLPSSLHLPAASAEENGLKNWMAVGAFAGLIVSSSFIR
jgi:hypothetical protein